MRYQHPQLRSQLAAEYALGTLRGRARDRFERLLRNDAGLHEEVVFWQERLSEFATRLKPVAPRDVVWTALEHSMAADARKTVPLRAAPRAATTAPARPWLWQAWAAVATVAAVTLGVALVHEQGRTATLVAALASHRQPPMPYVAVLQFGDSDVRWSVSLHPEQKLMRIALSGTHMPTDTSLQSLELWMLDSAGKPHSLGLLPVGGKGTPHDMPLPALPSSELGAMLTLAVSVEPMGGSPTGLPTGKVLGAVPAVKPI